VASGPRVASRVAGAVAALADLALRRPVTVPAAICSTLVTAAAAGVLAGSDLYPAREFGLAVAAGLLIDLVLLRVPLVAALARWGGAG
jgi:hypothetical protein